MSADVPDEWVAAARETLPPRKQGAIIPAELLTSMNDNSIRAIIAAVIPLIEAREREACARVADAEAEMQAYRTGRRYEDPEYLAKCDAKEEVANDIAVAIRARKEEADA